MSAALEDSNATRMALGIAPGLTAHPGRTGTYELSRGRDAIATRVLLARAAERSLDVQYYIWHGDHTGHLHRSNSRVQRAKSAAADAGQMMVIAVAPRRNSTRMSAGTAVAVSTSSGIGMNSPALAEAGNSPSRASCRQRCTTLALMPCDIATLATDAPDPSHSPTICAFTAALYLRRVSVFSLVIVSTYE